MRIPWTGAVALAVTLGVSSAAAAQERSHLGPQIGYNFDYEALVVGAQFGMPIGRQLELYPSFNWFFVDAGSLWAANVDLKYRLPFESADWLYIGGGLNVTWFKLGSASNSDAGVNLLAGIESRTGRIHPFGEVRLTASDGTSVQLVAGLNFTLGQH